MKPQQFQFGDQPWPEGQGVLQVYAPIDLAINPELAELVGKCRAASQGAPVTEVDDRFLHITLDVVAGCTSDQVSPAKRDELADALRVRLASVPAYQGSAGSCLAYVSGFVLDISPAGPLREVQRAVRSVIREVCGDAACTWSQAKPHIGLSYCHTATDSDPWQRKARQADPNHAPLRIGSVALVDVRPDNATKRLEWSPVAPAMPLAEV
jgi:hypothetical protein